MRRRRGDEAASVAAPTGAHPAPARGAAPSVRCLAVIPARLGSTRLPRKALLRESGTFLFQHVAERAARARLLDAVIVATDAVEIAEAASSAGIECRMTSPRHPSGTDRVFEVALAYPEASIVVNVQGDEPEIEPEDLDALVTTLEGSGADVATLATPFREGEDPADSNAAKVVLARDGRALYFSRAAVPFRRDGGIYLRHIGVYAFRRPALEAFAASPPSPLEQVEGLEQLRLLEIGGEGFRIQVRLTDSSPRGIDTRADYDRFLAKLRATGGKAWRSTSS